MPAGKLEKREFHDFAGGLNLIAEATELAPNESPDMLNMILTERGAAVKRLGNEAEAQGSLPNTVPTNLYWSNFLGQFLLQTGTKLWRRTAIGTWTEITRTGPVDAFPSAARRTIADFRDGTADAVVFISAVGSEGVQTYTGSGSITAAVAGPATFGAVWQNRFWTGSGVSSILGFSNPAVGNAYPNSVNIRDKDTAFLRAAIAAPIGNLLVFKDHSTYRINDSNTGSYTTIDANHGASGPLAVNSLKGIVCCVNEEGIWITDGNNALEEASAKIRPLFGPTMLNLALRDGWTVGITNDTFLISLSRVGSSVNDLTIEFDPVAGWMVPHSYGAVAFARSEGAIEETFLAHTAAVGSKAQIRKVQKGGSDGGAAIAAHFRGHWIRPERDVLAQLRRTKVTARGDFDFYISKDFQRGDGAVRSVSVGGTPIFYGGGVPGEYGPAGGYGYVDLYSWGPVRSASFLVRESSTISFNKPTIVGAGQEEEGAFSLYGVRYDFIPLGDA